MRAPIGSLAENSLFATVAPSSAILRPDRTSASVKISPELVFQSRILKKSVVTPLIRVFQFPCPPITCASVTTTGDTADTSVASRLIFMASATVSLL